MASFYDELVDLLLAGRKITAVQRLRAGADMGVADARQWVHDFGERVVVPIARGDRPRSEPLVIGIPGVMSGEPCVSSTRITAATIPAYLRDGAAEDDIRSDYPTLPEGTVQAVTLWAQCLIGADWQRLPFDPSNYELQRDVGESDADHAARRRLFGPS